MTDLGELFADFGFGQGPIYLAGKERAPERWYQGGRVVIVHCNELDLTLRIHIDERGVLLAPQQGRYTEAGRNNPSFSEFCAKCFALRALGTVRAVKHP